MDLIGYCERGAGGELECGKQAGSDTDALTQLPATGESWPITDAPAWRPLGECGVRTLLRGDT